MTPEDVSAGTAMVLGCIPVNSGKNRHHARNLGVGHIPMPPPYKGSVQDECFLCDGAVYVGPEQQKTLKTWPDTLIVCLICAWAYLGAGGSGIPVMSLSDKRSERGE